MHAVRHSGSCVTRTQQRGGSWKLAPAEQSDFKQMPAGLQGHQRKRRGGRQPWNGAPAPTWLSTAAASPALGCAHLSGCTSRLQTAVREGQGRRVHISNQVRSVCPEQPQSSPQGGISCEHSWCVARQPARSPQLVIVGLDVGLQVGSTNPPQSEQQSARPACTLQQPATVTQQNALLQASFGAVWH